jgi:hypothetical protein
MLLAVLVIALLAALATFLVLRSNGDARDRAVTGTAPAVTATTPLPACGPPQQGALEAAFAQLSPDPTTGRLWSGVPVAGNYDPCAELSAILVSVVGGTGSSPTQALLFHRGRYVGPATPRPYAFTALDAAASTGDTVVLTYRSGQSCTACGDGVVSTVRYHWDGAGVRMRDPAPPG